MGAFLGIEASSNNPAVGALAEQAGGVWDNQMERVGHMPPVLMIHGRDDQRVPFEKYAVPLEQTLKKRGGPLETRFFDHEGHRFSAAAQAQARVAAVEFLHRKVGAEKLSLEKGKPGRRGGGKTIRREKQSQPSY